MSAYPPRTPQHVPSAYNSHQTPQGQGGGSTGGGFPANNNTPSNFNSPPPGTATATGIPGTAQVPGTQHPDSYFSESRKGEVNELRQLLRNFNIERDAQRKRDIMKKVIAYMTLGIDVSRLFSEMMMAIETRDLVIKKMVYLYMSNYASSNPELAQMCTNTLQKDCGNEDPMVRGLALRALCSLNLPEMVEYIGEPLRKSLTDPHAYVRKTGVMAVLKLYHLDHDCFIKCDFVDIVYDMLRDGDANVVSNCILVLNEIMAVEGGMALNRAIMLHLLNRIHEFSEFGILPVLDLVARYQPANEEEMYQIMNLLDPVLRTNNTAAVLAIVKSFLLLTARPDGTAKPGEAVATDMQISVVQRVKAPLVTMVTGGIPEMVYTLLKHIDALVTLCPGVFDDEYRHFYVRISDPTNVKYLRVPLLAKLVCPSNASDIVAELGEYVTGSDRILSRLAIRALSRIACHDHGGEGCVDAIVGLLVEFLDIGISHVGSESAGALKDVLRRHSRHRASIAPILPRAIKFVTEPSGRASVIWLLGETGDVVQEAPYALEKLIGVYETLDATVKIALLTATLKLFFKRPPECQAMLGKLLKLATDDVSSQDLHDRALLYHRLLISPNLPPQTAKLIINGSSVVVAGEHKAFTEEEHTKENAALMKEFNTLSIIYGKVGNQFIDEAYQVPFVRMEATMVAESPMEQVATAVQPLSDALAATTLAGAVPQPTPPVVEETDLLGFFDEPATTAPTPSPPTTTLTLVPYTLSGDDYQTIWGQQTQPTLSTSLSFTSLPPSTVEVETAL
eukprot:CAMPEP_0194372510 /NCGR_PEP_ID=MMETSP0174-20130528/20900_1 /TAXON_ID=216777 /ORGANISM="Proboscia alata, Strain PI-D3" /LENGTH=790 /DNA_ID=CAMNT_0039151105 /DNA_START=134 /DNA_END=2502 /DNA_ORIENTATION=+